MIDEMIYQSGYEAGQAAYRKQLIKALDALNKLHTTWSNQAQGTPADMVLDRWVVGTINSTEQFLKDNQ